MVIHTRNYLKIIIKYYMYKIAYIPNLEHIICFDININNLSYNFNGLSI